ncbi:MAG: helix-turn-helix transcriptional regulator [Myxococcota bacterium]
MPRDRPFTDVQLRIGRCIRAARGRAGLTQQKAAERTGTIPYKYWQEIEGGRTNPEVETLCRIAVALETSFWDMLLSEASGLARKAAEDASDYAPRFAKKRRRGA